jgi:hypothetical protein
VASVTSAHRLVSVLPSPPSPGGNSLENSEFSCARIGECRHGTSSVAERAYATGWNSLLRALHGATQLVKARGTCQLVVLPTSPDLLRTVYLMPELLTIDDLSNAIRTPVKTLRHWRENGYGPKSAKIGRRVLYRRSDVELWLARAFND